MSGEKVTLTSVDIGKLEALLDPARPMTKAEADADVLLVKRWCRGPNLHSIEERKVLHAKLEACTSVEQINALAGDLRKRHDVDPASVETDFVKAHEAAFNLIHGFQDTIHRGVCGQDVNELIVADGKYDGKMHHLICPKCGSAHQYLKKVNLVPAA